MDLRSVREVATLRKILYIWVLRVWKRERGTLKQLSTMKSAHEWVIVRIDGKVAAISTDYRLLAAITARLAQQKAPTYRKITAETVGFEEVWKIRQNIRWEDMILFGTEFQKNVWRRLFDLTHDSEGSRVAPRLISYTDFADLCENKSGVRAVAHAIGLNPISVAIPCHLVIPKESIDYIRNVRTKAESTIFKGNDICMESLLKEKGIDFGEYALGRKLKRELIQKELS